MGLTEIVARDAGIDVVKRGSLVLVRGADAIGFVEACSKKGLSVLGIEGFVLDDRSLVPDVDAIADFSNVGSASVSIVEARRFLAVMRNANMLFDFTLK